MTARNPGPKPERSGKTQDGRFAPGQSGNPSGKPTGARNATLLALDAIGSDNAAAILEAVVNAAKNGDMRAAEILMSRIWPARKGRPVLLDLPAIAGVNDIVAALGAITAAVAAGEISPDEGAAVAGIIETQRRTIETLELDLRVAALEQSKVASP